MKNNYIYFKDEEKFIYINLDLIKKIEINYEEREIELDNFIIRRSLFDKAIPILNKFFDSQGIDTSDTNMQK